MNKNLIITGATGFVGSNLVEFLLNKNFNIYVICREDSNISNLNHIKTEINIFYYDNNIFSLIEYFKKTNAELVFHLASNFIAEHQPNQIDSLVNSNLTFGMHVLEAMKESGMKKLVNTGTSWQHYRNEKYNPVCLYAATKQAFESLIEYYVKAEDFKVITLKLFDTYGENDKRPKLINLLNQLADDKTELKMSLGEQPLNLVHIEDVCKAFFIAYNNFIDLKKSTHKKYFVKNIETYTLKQVISVFEKITNKKLLIDWGGRKYRKREVMELSTKGEILPNWDAKISLIEGLKRYKN